MVKGNSESRYRMRLMNKKRVQRRKHKQKPKVFKLTSPKKNLNRDDKTKKLTGKPKAVRGFRTHNLTATKKRKR